MFYFDKKAEKSRKKQKKAEKSRKKQKKAEKSRKKQKKAEKSRKKQKKARNIEHISNPAESCLIRQLKSCKKALCECPLRILMK